MKTWQEAKDSRTRKGEEWRVGGERFFHYPEACAYRYIAHLKIRRNVLYPRSRIFTCPLVVLFKSKRYWIEVTSRKDKTFNRDPYFILLDEKKEIIDKLVGNVFIFLNGYQEIDKLINMFPYKKEYLPVIQREIQ